MKFLRKVIFAATAFLILFATACKQKKAGDFTVIVHYKNADKMLLVPGAINPGTVVSGTPKVSLEEVLYGENQNPLLLDTGTLKAASGTLTLKGNNSQQAVYQLVIENGPRVALINDAAEITIDIDLLKFKDFYTISGSEGGKLLQNFLTSYSDKFLSINKNLAIVDSLRKTGAPDSAQAVLKNEIEHGVEGLNGLVSSTLSSSNNPAISLFILGLSANSFQKQDFEQALNDAVKKFPSYKSLAQLKENYDKQQNQPAPSKPESWIGKDAPALSLPDANGKMISITDFKGKYVLVDFWASWCGPCRAENPNVVNAYNKFKNKNFAILGVSLDKEKDKWQQAIATDGLTWTHVSDLKFWGSIAVETFKFEGIPYNVLIDPKGKIIAESLRGPELEEKLASVLK